MLRRSPVEGATIPDAPKYGIVPDAEMGRHPAASAWRALHPRAGLERIEVLTSKKKSTVYRLVGAGVDGSSVIAKRSARAMARVEAVVYEDLLPRSEVPAPHWYGLFDESGGEFAWIFVEDAGGVRYALDRQDDRDLAAEWLARLHRSVPQNGAVGRLPQRSSAHYREHLRRTRRAIERNVESAAVRVDHRDVLHAVLSQCRHLESNWVTIESICDRIPRTLTHGDLAVKNVRVRRDGEAEALVPFDWETAAWGVPVADLAQLTLSSRGSSLFPSLDVYADAMSEVWPHVTLDDVERWAHIGALFRLLAVMGWAAWSVDVGGAAKAAGAYRVYCSAIDETLVALALGGGA